MSELHALLSEAMAPHLGRELARERAGALAQVVANGEPLTYDAVQACVHHARITATTARWADTPRPSIAACAEATVVACGVLSGWGVAA